MNAKPINKGEKMKDSIIRWKELKKILGGEDSPSTVTIWRWEKEGIFPKRLKLGPNFSGWLKSEIDQWLEDRDKARFHEKKSRPSVRSIRAATHAGE
jgi:prophage regulatory protein